ncbi:MAG: hypothetical protein ABL907_11235, partial [Hyphomicrobium sp.]
KRLSLIAPQIAFGDMAGCVIADTLICDGGFLIFELHGAFDGGEFAPGKAFGAACDKLLQGHSGYEDVNEIAPERVGHLAHLGQGRFTGDFAGFKPGNALLGDLKYVRQYLLGHA